MRTTLTATRFVFTLTIILIVFFNLTDLTAQALNWKQLHYTPEYYAMNTVAFSPDGKSVAMAGAFGTFRVSTDEGSTWILKRYNFENEIHCLRWLTNEKFIAVGESGIVARFDRLGNLLDRKEVDVRTLFSISTDLAGCAVAVGDGGKIYKTVDNGESWSSSKVFNSMDTLRSCSILNNRVMAVGTSGLVFSSADKGESWKKQSAPKGATRLTTCQIKTNGECFVGGDTSIVSKTTDYGSSWIPLEIDSALQAIRFSVQSLKIIDEIHGVLVLNDIYNTESYLYLTIDGGSTWTRGKSNSPSISSYLQQIRELDFHGFNKPGFYCGFSEIVGTLTLFQNGGGDFSLTPIVEFRAPIFVENVAVSDSLAYLITADERLPNTYASVSSLLEINVKSETTRRVRLDSTVGNASIKYRSVHLVSGSIVVNADSIPWGNLDSTRTVLLVSKDNGNSWSRTKVPNGRVSSIAFTKTTIIAYSKIGGLIYSADLGASWQPTPLPTQLPTPLLHSGNDGRCYITGKSGNQRYTYRSENGVEWKKVSSNAPSALRVLTTKVGNPVFGAKAVGVNSDGVLYRYIDSTKYDSYFVGFRDPFSVGITDMVSSDNGTIYCTAGRYAIKYSTNNGDSWQMYDFSKALKYGQERGTYAENLRSISLVGNYLLVNSERSILYANLKTPLSVEQSIEESNLIKTNPPYPNPCSNKAKVLVKWFYGVDRSSVTSKLYNSFGEKIEDYTSQLTTNPVDQGALIDFDCSKLSSGIYYIKSQAGSESSTSSVVVAR